jgi:hypothetical protein
MELNVTNVLTIHSGLINPMPIPSAIATKILPRRLIFIAFMGLTNLLYDLINMLNVLIISTLLK